MIKKQLDDAWLKMQDRLKEEPASPAWTAFAQRAQEAQESRIENTQQSKLTQKEIGEGVVHLSAPATPQHKPKQGWPQRVQQYRRGLIGAAAAVLICIVLATPAGNDALAALLNQFRMEQVTAVERQDLEHLFNTAGITESTMNQYGEFSFSSSGELKTYPTIGEMQEDVARELLIPAFFQAEEPQNLHINVAPSRTVAMKVNVDKINETMRDLGAEKLLPASIDGKQITLSKGQTVRIKQKSTSHILTQQPVPSVSVESGVPVAEALEAVLQFPLIPAELKQELKQSHVLSSGSAPLPIVMSNEYERLNIANTDVLITKLKAIEGRYAAVWVKGGQLFTFVGTFPDQDAFTTMLKEMMGT